MSKAKTVISDNLRQVTKFIDPKSGQVLMEGSDPISTVKAFKENPEPIVKEEDKTDERLDNLEKGMEDIKGLLTKIAQK